MSRYRRSQTPGATYFFTLTTFDRRSLLISEPIRTALRKAIADTRERTPFVIHAWVLLPEHLHCIWGYVKDGLYPEDWGGVSAIATDGVLFGE